MKLSANKLSNSYYYYSITIIFKAISKNNTKFQNGNNLKFRERGSWMLQLRADVCDGIVEPRRNFSGLGDDGAADVGRGNFDDFFVRQTETSGARMIAWNVEKLWKHFLLVI